MLKYLLVFRKGFRAPTIHNSPVIGVIIPGLKTADSLIALRRENTSVTPSSVFKVLTKPFYVVLLSHLMPMGLVNVGY